MPWRPFHWFVNKHGVHTFSNDQLGLNARDENTHYPVFMHLWATCFPSGTRAALRSDAAQSRRLLKAATKNDRKRQRRLNQAAASKVDAATSTATAGQSQLAPHAMCDESFSVKVLVPGSSTESPSTFSSGVKLNRTPPWLQARGAAIKPRVPNHTPRLQLQTTTSGSHHVTTLLSVSPPCSHYPRLLVPLPFCPHPSRVPGLSPHLHDYQWRTSSCGHIRTKGHHCHLPSPLLLLLVPPQRDFRLRPRPQLVPPQREGYWRLLHRQPVMCDGDCQPAHQAVGAARHSTSHWSVSRINEARASCAASSSILWQLWLCSFLRLTNSTMTTFDPTTFGPNHFWPVDFWPAPLLARTTSHHFWPRSCFDHPKCQDPKPSTLKSYIF